MIRDDLRLITPAELEALPFDTVLTCINGETVVVGTDHIDSDTRGGFLAYGFLAVSE